MPKDDEDPAELVERLFGPDSAPKKPSEKSPAQEYVERVARAVPPADMTNCPCSECEEGRVADE